MFIRKRILKTSLSSLFLVLLFTTCHVVTRLFRSEKSTVVVPEYFPEIPYPADNTYSADRWKLGKLLFHDVNLSRDKSISCSSCHKQEFAFSDTVALSTGFENRPGTRNAPTLGNVAYHPYYIRDGGVATLEMQILVPVQEHNEFNFNILEIAERLQKNKLYTDLSKKAYNRELDYYVITRALANFERSMITSNSRYDRYFYQGKKYALNESEIRGMNLFFSEKLACTKCHVGINFTNYSFENNGIYEKYKDIGRKRLTQKEEDLEKFKVPTLRNIALTAPYMHDGSFSNLEKVIEHYNSGGKTNPRKNNLIKPLDLSAQEKADLIHFLKTLTDEEFIRDKKFK
ncbi:cytochrome-c peroxidase [Aurantibacillus circumpalustris]|uniref:cytochrome-c peroxidase n=1 Tax=Aurantibacillus circumpalustris TaxID=3036359 RepID=UPI00295B809A|nr:cytochrome c peroxidase [Aurantibacillus circumpalustris]